MCTFNDWQQRIETLPQAAREYIKKQLLDRLAEQLLLEMRQQEDVPRDVRATCCVTAAIQPE